MTGPLDGRWLIRVCEHGHRVEYRGFVQAWQHMDADAAYCDAKQQPEVVEVARVPDAMTEERHDAQ